MAGQRKIWCGKAEADTSATQDKYQHFGGENKRFSGRNEGFSVEITTSENSNAPTGAKSSRKSSSFVLPTQLDSSRAYHDAGPISVTNVKQLWPNGLGSQALYTLHVVLSLDGTVIATTECPIGFRTVELDQVLSYTCCCTTVLTCSSTTLRTARISYSIALRIC